MSKIKNLSELGDLYSAIQESAANMPAIESGNRQPDILLTDATQYVPGGKMVKPGEALGGGPAVKDGKEPLAKKTGPEGLKGNNFDKKAAHSEKAKEIHQAAEETEQEEGDMEAAEKSEEAPEKEKVEENVDSASKTPKYKKQTFTMPKSKFQKLYEDAINGGPFVNEEEEMTPVAPTADDAAAEIDSEPTGTEEQPLTHEEIIEMLEKALEALKKHAGYEDTHGGKDISAAGEEEEPHMGHEEEEEEAMAEAIEAEEMGHALVDGKSEELKDGHKIYKVGSLKQKGKAPFEGGPAGQDGATKKQPDSSHLKDGHKLHTAGNLKVDKGQSNAFEQ